MRRPLFLLVTLLAVSPIALSAQARQAAADAALKKGRDIEHIVEDDARQASRLTEARQAYEEAIQVGTPAQQVYARNHLGSLLVQTGKNSEAVQVFRQMDLTPIETSLRYIFEYNYGRALELSGETAGAYERYSSVVLKQPSFRPAVDRAFNILESSRQPRIDDAVRLSTPLLTSGQSQSALAHLKNLLKFWARDSDSQRLLTAIVRAYAAAELDPRTFETVEASFLSGIAETAAHLRSPISEIRLVYLGELKPVFTTSDARNLFPGWTGGAEQRAALSELLKVVGHYLDKNGFPAPALSRFATAWVLLPEKTDTAVEAAAVLRDHRDLLDRNGDLFQRLISGLFAQKGVAYAAEDWPNILRLHVVLGTIFERDRKWGSINEPESAIFQWSRAIEAEQRVRAANPGLEPSPGLHLHLANCYRAPQVNRLDLAVQEYLSAAEAFVQASNAVDATQALTDARSLGITLRPDQEQRLRSIEASIQRLRGM